MEDVMQHYSTNGGFSRRTVLAGAAGALALTSNEAAAQRCPEPPHAKGPRVWLDLDQKELDDAYDQSVFAFNQGNIRERTRANSEVARGVIGRPQRLAYGPTEIEKLDLYRTTRANAPIHMFIHGGAWHAGSPIAARAYLAEPFVQARAPFVMPGFIHVADSW